VTVCSSYYLMDQCDSCLRGNATITETSQFPVSGEQVMVSFLIYHYHSNGITPCRSLLFKEAVLLLNYDEGRISKPLKISVKLFNCRLGWHSEIALFHQIWESEGNRCHLTF